MDILYTTDNRYLDIMLSSIYSLLCNSNIKNLRFHIITSNFSKNDFKKVELFFKMQPNVEYYFYPLESFDIEKYNIPNWRNSQIANARLFFQEILKNRIDDIHNLLYLDSDTIIVDDLTELDNYKNGLYAVKDCGRLKRVYHSLGNLTNYYNSGVIFINVNEWLNNDYQSEIIRNAEQNHMKFVLPDQDLFNCALYKQIKTLPFRYNVPPIAYSLNDTFSKLYFNPDKKCISYEEVITEKQTPRIIHSYGFCNIKAWDSKVNPFYNEFMNYLLHVNPDFKANELSSIKKLVANFPIIYYLAILARVYMPDKVESKASEISTHIKKKMQ